MLRITAFDDPSTYGGAAWELAKREIAALQSQLALAEKKLELAIGGLGMIRELDRIGRDVTPKELSDYEQGMGSGFEIAAEVAATTVNNIEETEAKYKRERMMEERA